MRVMMLRLKTRVFARYQDFFLNLYGRITPGTKLYFFVMTMVRFCGGAFPLVLKLDITQRCNIQCAMCYAPHSSAEMPYEKAVEVLSQFTGMSTRLDLMGGEPCIHADLPAIISYAKNKARFREVQIFTNATLVDAPFAERLKASGLDGAMVNFFSYDPALHDAGTGVKGSWRKTVAGLLHLRNAGINAHPFIVMHARNVEDYEKIKLFSMQTFGVMPMFFQYIPVHENDPIAPDPIAWAAVKRKILYDDQPDHRRTITKINTMCGRCCLGGYFSVSVKVSGDITPCPFIYDVVIGNAFDPGFWPSFAGRMMSASYRDFISVPDECGSCTYVKVCRGSCRAGFKKTGESFDAKDHRCLGPWKEPLNGYDMWDKMPTFF